MSLQKFITNPYMEGIYQSFLGSYSDEEYYQLLESAVKKQLGTKTIEVQKVECGVGLALQCLVDDNFLVHVKIVKGIDAMDHQTECCRVQKYLVSQGFPGTVPIGLPVRVAGQSLQIEEHNTRGEYRDSHKPAVMRLQAEHLAQLNTLLDQYQSPNRGDLAKKTIPRDTVWQNPPQAVFSFDKHQTGDEPIKGKAKASKSIFEASPGQRQVLTHEDWSNKHFRFSGDRVSVIYDWDSLSQMSEYHNLGLACSTFTATWYIPTRIFPTKEESKAFVQAYSSYTGKVYSKDERQLISSYAAYTLAYIARCVFAINDGSIQGNAIEQPFLDIENGQYF